VERVRLRRGLGAVDVVRCAGRDLGRDLRVVLPRPRVVVRHVDAGVGEDLRIGDDAEAVHARRDPVLVPVEVAVLQGGLVVGGGVDDVRGLAEVEQHAAGSVLAWVGTAHRDDVGFVTCRDGRGEAVEVGVEVGELRLDRDVRVLLLESADGLLGHLGAVGVAPPGESDGRAVAGGCLAVVVLFDVLLLTAGRGQQEGRPRPDREGGPSTWSRRALHGCAFLRVVAWPLGSRRCETAYIRVVDHILLARSTPDYTGYPMVISRLWGRGLTGPARRGRSAARGLPDPECVRLGVRSAGAGAVRTENLSEQSVDGAAGDLVPARIHGGQAWPREGCLADVVEPGHRDVLRHA